MKHTVFTLLAAAALVLAAVTLGRDTPARITENVTPAASGEVSIHGYGDGDDTCQEWTDGCRTCRRPATGEPFCSNMPIACQPATVSCAQRTEPAK